MKREPVCYMTEEELIELGRLDWRDPLCGALWSFLIVSHLLEFFF